MNETSVLSIEDIRNGISKLKANDLYRNLFWVDVENFFKSETAKRCGWACTQEELDVANLKSDGLIKSVRGVDLYLSKAIKFNL